MQMRLLRRPRRRVRQVLRAMGWLRLWVRLLGLRRCLVEGELMRLHVWLVRLCVSKADQQRLRATRLVL